MKALKLTIGAGFNIFIGAAAIGIYANSFWLGIGIFSTVSGLIIGIVAGLKDWKD